MKQENKQELTDRTSQKLTQREQRCGESASDKRY
jgi:hypothetical protein